MDGVPDVGTSWSVFVVVILGDLCRWLRRVHEIELRLKVGVINFVFFIYHAKVVLGNQVIVVIKFLLLEVSELFIRVVVDFGSRLRFGVLLRRSLEVSAIAAHIRVYFLLWDFALGINPKARDHHDTWLALIILLALLLVWLNRIIWDVFWLIVFKLLVGGLGDECVIQQCVSLGYRDFLLLIFTFTNLSFPRSSRSSNNGFLLDFWFVVHFPGGGLILASDLGHQLINRLSFSRLRNIHVVWEISNLILGIQDVITIAIIEINHWLLGTLLSFRLLDLNLVLGFVAVHDFLALFFSNLGLTGHRCVLLATCESDSWRLRLHHLGRILLLWLVNWSRRVSDHRGQLLICFVYLINNIFHIAVTLFLRFSIFWIRPHSTFLCTPWLLTWYFLKLGNRWLQLCVLYPIFVFVEHINFWRRLGLLFVLQWLLD